MSVRLIRVLALTILIFTATSLRAQQFAAAGVSDSAALTFFKHLQTAVRRHDDVRIWRLTGGTLRVNWPDTVEYVRTRGDFLSRYSRIFSRPIRNAILRQLPESLFVNAKGIMIGSGEVWFGGDCSQPDCKAVSIRLLAVNEPVPPVVTHDAPLALAADFLPRGRWWPDSISCPYSCTEGSLPDSARWWNDGLYFAHDSASLIGEPCVAAEYRRRELPVDSAPAAWRIQPHLTGLGDSVIRAIDVLCDGAEHPRLTLLVRDTQHLWALTPGAAVMLVSKRKRKP
ncbi:MAG: hypothetical protein ABJD11_17260 [Gemmatimonadota bacterium]